MTVKVTRDELDAKPFDGSVVRNVPEGVRVRWVRKDPTNLQRMRDRGYVFVNPTTAKGVSLVEDPRTGEVSVPDGSHHRGSLVLMMISEDKYQQRRRSSISEAKRRVESDRDRYKEQARRMGLRPVDEPGEGVGYTRRMDEQDYKEMVTEQRAKARERR